MHQSYYLMTVKGINMNKQNVPGIPKNKPPIFEAHELLFGEFTQIEAHGLLKIHS